PLPTLLLISSILLPLHHSILFPYTTLFPSHHYALVYDGTSVSLFWDGTQIGSAQPRSGNLDSGTTAPTFGWGSVNPLYYHLNGRSEEHTSELQSRAHLACRLLAPPQHSSAD